MVYIGAVGWLALVGQADDVMASSTEGFIREAPLRSWTNEQRCGSYPVAQNLMMGDISTSGPVGRTSE